MFGKSGEGRFNCDVERHLPRSDVGLVLKSLSAVNLYTFSLTLLFLVD